MPALARNHVTHSFTRAANDDCINGGSCTRTKYTYDLGGRRTSAGGTLAGFVPPAYVATTSYDGTNRLTSWGGSSLGYDANGNLTGFGVTTYTWNARNQMTATNAGSATFAYDALGRRVSATVNGATSTYLYDGLNVAVTGGNLMMASGNLDEIFAQVGSSTTTSYLRDGTNSTASLTSTSGAISANYYYSPYGDSAQSGSTATAFQYTGRENDGPTGLYYYRARYYSPQLGRFISEDPLGSSAGTNFYAAVNGNPISLIDPLGLLSIPEAVVGYGDGVSRMLTLGLWSTADYRAAHDIGSIDMCSASYRAGKYFGWAWGGVTLWSAGLVPKPNAVFWRGGGRAAALAAGNTIQDTFIGGLLTGFGITNEYVWAAASAPYAANAVGAATLYVGEGGSWISAMEMWILEARGVSVTTIF